MDLVLTVVWLIIQEFLLRNLNLAKFPDPVEFQSWWTNFRAEVCLKTADPQVTMLWITEVEIAKSTDELKASRSIVGRTDFVDIDTIDSMIASALQKIVPFRKRVFVEEQRAQIHDRFF